MSLDPSRALALATVAGLALTPAAAAGGALAPCPDDRFGPGAECGHYTVLEDRQAGTGRTLDLNLVLLRATSRQSREPLFLLAGGPGQGATDLAELALGPFSPVREVRDIVLVDQRGTGASNRLDCPNQPITDPRSVFGKIFDPALIRQCYERALPHANPALYLTDHAVDDLDEVRGWLGYEKVFLWGGSGGTRTALVWMRRHPERVAGALLDGVTPTDFRAPSTYARGCQDSLERVLEDCQRQASCRTAYPDLEADFAKLISLFEKGPVATQVQRSDGAKVAVEMSLGDLGYALRGLLYRSQSIARLPGLIHRAATTGDVGGFAQPYWQREVAVRPVVAMGLHLSIFCAEDLPFIAEGEVKSLTEATFLGTYLFEQYRAACREWATARVPESFLEAVRSEAPVLLFSGYYDPSTPPRLGDQVAQHLPNSRHVVVRNESHGAEFGCGRQLAIDFMISGSLEGLGPACGDAGPIQFEIGP